jgi:glutathione synthase/RimK-type ligase-like ATP-grasp enzyme
MVTESLDLPVSIFVFSPMRWEDNLTNIKGYELTDGIWNEVERQIPNIIYDRFTAKAKGEKEQYLKFRNFLVSKNTNFTTPLSLVTLLKDKVQFHRYLLKKGIPTLPAVIIKDLTRQEFDNFFEYNSVLYIKPISGSNGAGISILETYDKKGIFKEQTNSIEVDKTECFEYLINNFDKDNYFIQPKAKTLNYEDKPYDIRVLIQNYGHKKYKITGQGVRIGEQGNWISNISAGGGAKPLEVLKPTIEKNGFDFSEQIEKMEKMCIDCTHALHDFYGDFVEIAFDILLTEDLGPIILEGNSKPARWIFNLLSDNYPKNSPEFKKFQKIRMLSVKLPLIFITNVYQSQKMENFEILVEAPDHEIGALETADLQNWLKSQNIGGLRVERKASEVQQDSMGGFIETALVLTVIARPVLIELVKSLSIWFTERKPKASVKITNAEGKTIEFSGENLPNLEKTIEKLISQQ